VREALIAFARSRGRADLALEAERLSADRGDRAEKKKIAKMVTDRAYHEGTDKTGEVMHGTGADDLDDLGNE